MKTRLFSLSGAVALSFAHLLLEMWRGFNDFTFVFPEDIGSSGGIITPSDPSGSQLNVQ